MPSNAPDIQLNHVALVVDDMDAALQFWRDALGLTGGGTIQAIPDEGVNVAFLRAGDSQLELIQPTESDNGVARYLQKRGPGLHHLCLEVPDLEAQLRELAEQGIELINEVPRERDGRRYAFAHPRGTGGVLLELYERC